MSRSSAMPKTAVNFHKMKKGLYLHKAHKDFSQFLNKQGKKIYDAYDINGLTASQQVERRQRAQQSTAPEV